LAEPRPMARLSGVRMRELALGSAIYCFTPTSD
jgi:hypothetical protein